MFEVFYRECWQVNKLILLKNPNSYSQIHQNSFILIFSMIVHIEIVSPIWLNEKSSNYYICTIYNYFLGVYNDGAHHSPSPARKTGIENLFRLRKVGQLRSLRIHIQYCGVILNNRTIFFVQSFHERSVNECMEGICHVFEEHLKRQNPQSASITYDISQLFDFIDELNDLTCLVRIVYIEYS